MLVACTRPGVFHVPPRIHHAVLDLRGVRHNGWRVGQRQQGVQDEAIGGDLAQHERERLVHARESRRLVLGRHLKPRSTPLQPYPARIGQEGIHGVGRRVHESIEVGPFVAHFAFPRRHGVGIQCPPHFPRRAGQQVSASLDRRELHGLVRTKLRAAKAPKPILLAPVQAQHAANVHSLSIRSQQRRPHEREVARRKHQVVQRHPAHQAVVGVPTQRWRPKHLTRLGIFQPREHAELKRLHASKQASPVDVVFSVVVERDAIAVEDPTVSLQPAWQLHTHLFSWSNQRDVQHGDHRIFHQGRGLGRG